MDSNAFGTPMAVATIVIGGVVFLVGLSLLFKGKVHF
jgi:hypothetical protein